MNGQRHKRDTMSLEEATISNMGEIAAIVEVLEREGGIMKCSNSLTKYRRVYRTSLLR